MACLGPYGFFEQGRTNPYGPARASRKKNCEQYERKLGNFFSFY